MTASFDAQDQLQREADDVVAMLDLNGMLAKIGQPVRVGSSAMGLMVARDIDLTVICPKLDAATLAAFVNIGGVCMRRTDIVLAVRFRNDAGQWNQEPEQYPDGFYLCVTVALPSGKRWNIDIWAVDDPTRQPDLAHLRTLLPRLTALDRGRILAIKQVLAERPDGTRRRARSSMRRSSTTESKRLTILRRGTPLAATPRNPATSGWSCVSLTDTRLGRGRDERLLASSEIVAHARAGIKRSALFLTFR